MLLSVETSCDETALCLSDLEFSSDALSNLSSKIIYEEISSQIDLHRQYGGVVPELAAREHTKNLPILIDRAFKIISPKQLKAVAVTRGPGLKGCLLVGMSFCKALAQSLKVPLLAVNHLEAHFFSGFLLEQIPEYPILTLLVSGGHTQLFLCSKPREYRLIASTRDDAAGEAFDKGATLLGLSYPGGPSLSKRADLGDTKYFTFPNSLADDPSSFSFSGLKTALSRKVKELGELNAEQVNDVSACYQEAIVESLVLKSISACIKEKPKSFLVTGGVAANKRLREVLSSKISALGIKFHATPSKWCTDNATMVAATAHAIVSLSPEQYQNWKPIAGSLGPNVSTNVGVVSRWPIDES